MYWDEIAGGLAEANVPLQHVVLHADRATLTSRIKTDDTLPDSARQWRLDHVADYEDSFDWLGRKARIIDTCELAPAAVTDLLMSR